jgi:hypothetical protein
MPIITMAHHNSLLGNYDGEYTYPYTPVQDSNVASGLSAYSFFVNKFYTKTSNGTNSGIQPWLTTANLPDLVPLLVFV